MKIIYLHQYFNTPDMVGATRSYEMARRFVAAGHEVHMITSQRVDSQQTGWFESDEAGIQVHWYPVPYSNHMSYRKRLVSFLSFALAARNKVTELEGDVIFASSTPLTIAIPAVPAARKKKIPLVFEVRDLWPEMPIAMGVIRSPLLKSLAYKLEKWAYNNSAAIVALSPGMKEGVVKSGYPAEKVAVIPNSSDNNDFRYDALAERAFRVEREWLNDKPLLVYTGAFGKVNGVCFMVKLAKELLDCGSNIRILLVGDGMELVMLKQTAKQSGVYLENLFIEESLSKKEMPALLSAATFASNLVIDLPEARANSANKFFDALAAGKPILLNHGGWMHELVQKHQCGLGMWQRPIREVAEELDDKMNDPVWLYEAGKAARKLAEVHFDRDDLAEQLMSVLSAAAYERSFNVEKVAPGSYG